MWKMSDNEEEFVLVVRKTKGKTKTKGKGGSTHQSQQLTKQPCCEKKRKEKKEQTVERGVTDSGLIVNEKDVQTLVNRVRQEQRLLITSSAWDAIEGIKKRIRLYSFSPFPKKMDEQ
eukprot:m.11334 g.11334  ORF g.11334 m.11334 type:complete len:117 (+) comp6881_c0_seq2:38-388(+)